MICFRSRAVCWLVNSLLVAGNVAIVTYINESGVHWNCWSGCRFCSLLDVAWSQVNWLHHHTHVISSGVWCCRHTHFMVDLKAAWLGQASSAAIKSIKFVMKTDSWPDQSKWYIFLFIEINFLLVLPCFFQLITTYFLKGLKLNCKSD